MLRLCLALGFGLVGVGLAVARAPAAESLWLAVERPAENERVRLSAPLVEVRGRTLIGESQGSGREIGELVSTDVVLALDFSNTALLAMGLDVDGDGKVGKDRTSRFRPNYDRPYRFWTTDPDDTIIRSELLAARALTDRLGERGARLGVVTYTGRPRARAQVGSPEQAVETLEGLKITVDWTGTDISRALRLARDMLADAPRKRGPGRPRVVLLFSDGQPTAPHNEFLAERRALDAARELSAEGVQVYTLAFGEEAREEPGVLLDIASITGGRFIRVMQPTNVLADLASVEFAKPWGLAIRNLTIGRPARAVRVFTDGSFDGFVDLALGENQIEVLATGSNGDWTRVRRTVFYEKPDQETLEDRRRAARMLVELRHRGTETELASRGQRAPVRERTIEIYPEVVPPQP